MCRRWRRFPIATEWTSRSREARASPMPIATTFTKDCVNPCRTRRRWRTRPMPTTNSSGFRKLLNGSFSALDPMDLTSLTIDGTRSAVQKRETTALALAEAHYARIKQEDGQIGAFLTLSKERALEQADRIDRMAAEGKTLPPLGGVPVGIKDVMSTRGLRTTARSKILEKYIPPFDCTALARMEAAGAVVLGKMNCDEVAMGSSNENSAYHPPRNPRDPSRMPGGASGGS